MSIVRKSAQGARGASNHQHPISREGIGLSSAGLQTPNTGSVVGGRYRLIRLLGRGAMGSVYQAEDQFERRCCAVKMLNNAGNCSADELRRFHNEATAISRLSHPNIVQVYDFLKDAYGRSYLVMELLEGVDLFAYLQAEGRLTLRRTQEIIAPVAAALYSAHRLGIIHRDIKPRNIFLSQQAEFPGPSEVVKVVDFGLAKVQSAQHQQTAHGVILGTPEYMSPEATLGRSDEVDARSDQWALAVTAYRLLSGCLPFEEDDVIQLLLRIRTSPPRPLRELVPDVPAHAEQAITRALSRRKEERFPDIRAFAEAFVGTARMTSLVREPRPSASLSLAGSARQPVSVLLDEPTRPISEELLNTLLAEAGNGPAGDSQAPLASPKALRRVQAPCKVAGTALPRSSLALGSIARIVSTPSWLHRASVLLLAPLFLLSGAPDTPFQEPQSLAARSVIPSPTTATARSIPAATNSAPVALLIEKNEQQQTGAPTALPDPSHTPSKREVVSQRSRRLLPRVHTGARGTRTASAIQPADSVRDVTSAVPDTKRSAPLERIQIVDDEDASPRDTKTPSDGHFRSTTAQGHPAAPRISPSAGPNLPQSGH
jgi:serine/threonine protein kinase